MTWGVLGDGATRRDDRDAEPQPGRRARVDLHELPYDGAVLAYSRVPDDQAKPHDQWDGDDHEAASGFPSSNGHIPFERGTVAEVLGELGWNTYMVGKWH